MSTISVIGCGYLGAVHAAAMVSLGHTVYGIDVDAEKIQALSEGRPPFYEPGLEELLHEGQDTGRLLFTTDFGRISEATVHFICVGTPQSAHGNSADLRFVHSAVDTVVNNMTPGSVVVGKSTVPVGTAASLEAIVSEHHGELVWNPEFLREGHAIEDTIRPSRLVYGVKQGAPRLVTSRESDSLEPSEEAGASAIDTLDEVYRPIVEAGTLRMVTDFATAELVKTAANAFLATKISFINAMADMCDAAGADVTVLADALGLDDRIGRKFLNAGLGFGGGCLPKDIRAFAARAEELGASSAVTFLHEVDAINLARRTRTADMALRLVAKPPNPAHEQQSQEHTYHERYLYETADTAQAKIAVLGAAFKPQSDDVRDSPALAVAAELIQHGVHVTITDPQALELAKKHLPEAHFTEDVAAAVEGVDAVLLLTEWPEYCDLTPEGLAPLVRQKKILDARNVLTPAQWLESGWEYKAPGRRW